MKTGRNEPCPCGSGKKYKVCCGAAPDTESPQILAWRRLSRAVQDHAPKLLSFIAESHGRAAIPEAWEEFTHRSGEPFDPESPQVTLFYPWLFHVWRPLTSETEVEARTAAGREKVDALIKDIERMGPGIGGYNASITDNLRKTLGI